MGKNGELSPIRRVIIIEMRNQKKFKDIANQINASETASKQAFYNWKKFETFKLSPRSGRPRVYRINQQIQKSSEMDSETLVEKAQCQSGQKNSTCVNQEKKM